MAEGQIKGDLSGIDFHIDVSGLFTEETFQKDIDDIFRKSWLPVGHDYELPNSGDFKTKKIPGLNYSLLIVRGKDDKIRAFHNICRHRGNKLVCKEAGSSRQGFSCGYHGWTYNIDGSLRGITDREQFPPRGGDETLGLKEVRCDVRHSYIFVNFDEDAESLDDWLGCELASPALYEGFFDNFRSTGLMTTTVGANWNILMDAFSEGYHTLFVHKNTGRDFLGGEDNPMRHPSAMELLGKHSRLCTPANPDHQWSPAETLAYTYAARAFPSFDSNSEGTPPGVNFGNAEFWAFDVVKLFPNTIILIGKDWIIDSFTWPISKDKSLYEFNMYLRNPKDYGERVAQEFSYIVAREIACEDLFLLEKQQEVLESEAMTDYYLSFQELMVAHHYRSRKEMSEKVGA